LIALINEIKLQNEIIEKKYIEKNKNLKAKIKEMVKKDIFRINN